VRARYEVRVGRREALALAAALAAMTAVVFGAGILVGRGMGRPAAAPPAVGSPALGAAVAMPRKSEPPPADPAPKTAAARAEERLTFYKTLTSPTTDLPPVGKPTIEEHLVPREELPAVAPPEAPAPAPGLRPAPAPSAARPAPERRIPVARAEPSPARIAGRAAPRAAVPPPPPRPAAVAPPGPEPGDQWTVQVSAFRSRALADELRARLAARGFDAYVLASATEEGRPRYRVRVGAYPTRTEAERVAAELRTERGLNPLVTSRAR
jgi:DedD protein